MYKSGNPFAPRCTQAPREAPMQTLGNTMKIQPAKSYLPADDVWIITSYYNPEKYRSREKNFEVFRESLARSGVNWKVVECAFGDEPFTLPDDSNVIRVRGGDVMWQKERLLNTAIEQLPPECTKIAWCDCDVLFEREDWLVETSRLLEDYLVLQPFRQVIRLPPDTAEYTGQGDAYTSFGALINGDPSLAHSGYFDLHGHTGFAWAARRDFLTKYGLYDACLTGSGDHLMAHAFCGDTSSRCMVRILGRNPVYTRHVEEWARKVHEAVDSRVGYVDGSLLHLWHGERSDSDYDGRNVEFKELGFDPEADLERSPQGAWRWKRPHAELQDWAHRYFGRRKEDG